MTKKFFFKKYFKNFINLINFDSEIINKLEIARKYFLKIKKVNKKILIFGNGGSAAIASHFAIDLIKNTRIKCLNFSDPSFITCLANDFNYENWVEQSIDYYADKKDLVVIISSSGESKNMIKASRFAKKKKIKLITLTGFKNGNTVSKLGSLNFWIDSKKYNYVENAHQILLLSIIDSIS